MSLYIFAVQNKSHERVAQAARAKPEAASM